MAAQGNGMEKVAEIFEQAAEKFPKHKEQLLSDLGKDALQAVRRNIGSSIRDRNGRIRAGQHIALGEGRGYAAVRPIIQPGGGRNSIKPVTIFLDRGHLTRGHRDYVQGHYFYDRSVPQIKRAAERRAKELEEKLKDDLSGSV